MEKPQNVFSDEIRIPSMNLDDKEIDKFNDEAFSDVEFMIPGMDKSLCLHSRILAQASNMLNETLRGKERLYGRYDKNSHCIEWTCDRTKHDLVYRSILLKWLRFCYGEAITLKWNEFCSSCLFDST